LDLLQILGKKSTVDNIIQHGGLMVIYHGTKQNIILNKSKHAYGSSRFITFKTGQHIPLKHLEIRSSKFGQVQ